MELLHPLLPALQNLSAQGEAGRLRFSQITRIVTVPLASLQALGQVAIFVRVGVFDLNRLKLFGPNWLETLSILLSLTAGTLILVWIGELITERGIGNGISMIILAGIVSRLPQLIQQGFLASSSAGATGGGFVSIVVFLLIGLLTILGIVAILPFVARVGGNQLLSSAALLIAVGVVLDMVRQLDAHMVMRNYSGVLSCEDERDHYAHLIAHS